MSALSPTITFPCVVPKFTQPKIFPQVYLDVASIVPFVASAVDKRKKKNRNARSVAVYMRKRHFFCAAFVRGSIGDVRVEAFIEGELCRARLVQALAEEDQESDWKPEAGA